MQQTYIFLQLDEILPLFPPGLARAADLRWMIAGLVILSPPTSRAVPTRRTKRFTKVFAWSQNAGPARQDVFTLNGIF